MISTALDGFDVLNFGFSSGGHNPYIFERIEKRLDKNVEDKIIVLGLTPYSLTKKAQGNAHFRQELERENEEIALRRYVNPTLVFFDSIKPTDIIYANDTTQGYYENFRSDEWVESKRIRITTRQLLKVM